MFNHSGNKSQFTTLKKGESSVQRCEKQLLIVYDEQSIMDRPGVRTLQFDHHVFPPSDAEPWEAWEETELCCQAKRDNPHAHAAQWTEDPEKEQAGPSPNSSLALSFIAMPW